MPNWCSNNIEVSGKVSELKKFDNQFKSKYKSYGGGTSPADSLTADVGDEDYKKYLAYKIVPREDKYNFDKTGIQRFDVHFIDAEEETEGYSFNNFVPMSKEAHLEGWYEWSIEHWGTKWDMNDDSGYEYAESLDEAIAEGKLDEEFDIVYYFDTAWGPSCPVVTAMAEAYPSLSFIHTYDECGMCFAGKNTYNDGKLVEELENSNDENGYRVFVRDNLDDERYPYVCKDCGCPIEDCEMEEDENVCPNCESKNIIKSGEEDNNGKQEELSV